MLMLHFTRKIQPLPKIVFTKLLTLASSSEVPAVLRSRKSKSQRINSLQKFRDSLQVHTVGGTGGNGCVSFMQLWCNPNAGPDGGDGGNGGHVLLQASHDVSNLSHISSVIKADDGEKGSNDNCHGQNAPHTIIKVPIGSVVRNKSGIIVGDLTEEGAMFVAARGGAGGKGNNFFATDVNQAPQVAECGAHGENNLYFIELARIAHVGLIGFPNAGKSTLLHAISRARPKIAPYPFTTLQPNLGIVPYEDHEQIIVADLPGLIPDSHRNKGLGIAFLKHAERCSVLLFLLDASEDEPWETLNILRDEINHFNPRMLSRPSIIVANKIDLLSAQGNLHLMESFIEEPIFPVSAKQGINLQNLLHIIRKIYDKTTTQRKLKDKE